MTRAQSRLEVDLDQLEQAPRDELVRHWTRLFDLDLPVNMSSKLVKRAVAYQLQVRAKGGPGPSTCKELRRVARKGGTPCPIKRPSRMVIKPGTRLIRDWNGRTHVVDAIDRGFVWEGREYRSLSAIARTITGARWSGPRFFGL